MSFHSMIYMLLFNNAIITEYTHLTPTIMSLSHERLQVLEQQHLKYFPVVAARKWDNSILIQPWIREEQEPSLTEL